jgi:hypothetical protein
MLLRHNSNRSRILSPTIQRRRRLGECPVYYCLRRRGWEPGMTGMGQLEPFLSREPMPHSSLKAVIHGELWREGFPRQPSDLRISLRDLLLSRFGGPHDHIDQLVTANCGVKTRTRRCILVDALAQLRVELSHVVG